MFEWLTNFYAKLIPTLDTSILSGGSSPSRRAIITPEVLGSKTPSKT